MMCELFMEYFILNGVAWKMLLELMYNIINEYLMYIFSVVFELVIIVIISEWGVL